MMVGLVLAGGRSSRFGTEKAVAPWADGMVMDIPLRALRSVCTIIALSVRPGSAAQDRAEASGLTWLHDDPVDADGPLAGIHRGLIWAAEYGASWLALAPCDAITLRSDHYDIMQRVLAGRDIAVVGRSSSGLEPLVSIWPTGAGLTAVSTALTGGRHPSIRMVLSALDAVEVPLADFDGANVNRPEDLPDHAFPDRPARTAVLNWDAHDQSR